MFRKVLIWPNSKLKALNKLVENAEKEKSVKRAGVCAICERGGLEPNSIESTYTPRALLQDFDPR